VFSYGYNANTVFTSAVTDIEDEAAALLDYLVGERLSSHDKRRPIIFVSQSLGGIIVKKVSYLKLVSAFSYHLIGHDYCA
jgi:hypothetical protein